MCTPEPVESHVEQPEFGDDSAADFDGDEDSPLRVPHLRIYESPWLGYRVSDYSDVATSASFSFSSVYILLTNPSNLVRVSYCL